MQKIAKDAPAGIRVEAQVAAKGLKQMAGGKTASPEIDAGQAASDHVDSYAQAQCPGATAAAANANATPTTQTIDSSGNGAGSSIDNGTDSSSYNGNGYGSYNDNSSSGDSCDYSSIDC